MGFLGVLLLVFACGCLDSASTRLVKRTTEKVLVQASIGETVTLECKSNDKDHNFMFWFSTANTIIAPGNPYNNAKFRYEVLSGNLTIKEVSKLEENQYYCVSQGVVVDNWNIHGVHLIVEQDWEELYEHDPNVNLYRVIAIFSSLLVLTGLVYLGYRIWRNRVRYGYKFGLQSEDDEDEDEEELYNRAGPSKPNYEHQNIRTDFNSILDIANNK